MIMEMSNADTFDNSLLRFKLQLYFIQKNENNLPLIK